MSFSQKIARFFTSIGVGIKDFFVSLPIDIAKGFLKCVKAIGRFFINFHKRFVDGSIGTKLSHFFIGAGNFYHKQYVKGAIYLLLQIGFIALFTKWWFFYWAGVVGTAFLSLSLSFSH